MNKTTGISTLTRAELFQKISTTFYDVLIIGGGIMGAGIALDAASRNLKVLLVEKQDFAAGTSSRSTKLIHGGLRYLKNLEFGLVRTTARERLILRRNAPHLVEPEPMLLPLLQVTSFGYWPTKAGLMLYDWLGNVGPSERHRMLGKQETLNAEPLLKAARLDGAGFFYEYRTDDARLTLEVLKTANAFGADCLNYSEFTDFTYSVEKKIDGAVLINQLTREITKVKACCIINASGPWSSKILQNDQPEKPSFLYHTKGVHLVVPFQKLPIRQAIYFDVPGDRMIFAIPRQNITYLGTTDTLYKGKLENPEVTQSDALYLLDQINQIFPDVNLTLKDVVSSWAGVRPLIYEAGKDPSAISRKDEIFVSPSGLITVAGGKLTGYRHLAEKVVDKAINLFFREKTRKAITKNIKLSGGNFEKPEDLNIYQENLIAQAKRQSFNVESLRSLLRKYGSNTEKILQKAIEFKAENHSLEISILKAEIWYAITAEGATSLSDFLIRRTGMLYFEREKIKDILEVVTSTFQEILNWNEETCKNQLSEFLTFYEAAIAFQKEPVSENF